MGCTMLVHNFVLLENMDIHIIMPLLLTILATLLLTAHVLASRKKTRVKWRDLKPSMEVLDTEVRFNKELVVEKGSLIYARILTPYGTTQSHIKWVGTGTVFQTMKVHIKDLCLKPPHVLKTDREVYVKLPALRILTENLKNTIIACFDTRNLKARGLVNLVYTNGYARAEIMLSRGIVDVNTNWVVLEPTSTRLTKEILQVELCSKEFNTCTELLKMVKPGTSRATVRYPETFKVLVGYSDEKIFDELYELAKSMSGVFGLDNVEVHVSVRAGLRIVAESRASLVQA